MLLSSLDGWCRPSLEVQTGPPSPLTAARGSSAQLVLLESGMWLDLSYYSGHHSCWALEHLTGGVLWRVNWLGLTRNGHFITGPMSFSRPEIRRDYPLNLSISLRGGKETNKDSLSNGE